MAQQQEPQPIRLVAVCFIIQVSLGLILGPRVANDLIAVQTTVDAHKFRAIVGQWTAADIERFRWHFALDFFIYPMVYGTMLRRRIRAVLHGQSSLAGVLQAVATCGAAMDIVENALHFSALPDLVNAPDWVVLAAASAAITKWLLLLPLAILLLPGVTAFWVPASVAPKAKAK
jgi:hypothetical protein